MESAKGMRARLGGAVYILPNLLTTGNLFFGYFSIIKAIQGNFAWASGAILLAAIFDVLDGRVARLARASSEFGVQYDSLCDLVSFGLAPAILAYQFVLHQVGRMGWILCFLLVAGGALRLARFNVQAALGKTQKDFIGLPIPMAAATVACFVGFIADIEDLTGEVWIVRWLHYLFEMELVRIWILGILMPLLAFLMVSNLAYRSHKSIVFRGIRPFKLLALLVMVVSLIAYKPTLLGLCFFLIYALSGIVDWIFGWKRAADEGDIFEAIEHNTSIMGPDGDEK